jgi:hypothetical protein
MVRCRFIYAILRGFINTGFRVLVRFAAPWSCAAMSSVPMRGAVNFGRFIPACNAATRTRQHAMQGRARVHNGSASGFAWQR